MHPQRRRFRVDGFSILVLLEPAGLDRPDSGLNQCEKFETSAGTFPDLKQYFSEVTVRQRSSEVTPKCSCYQQEGFKLVRLQVLAVI